MVAVVRTRRNSKYPLKTLRNEDDRFWNVDPVWQQGFNLRVVAFCAGWRSGAGRHLTKLVDQSIRPNNVENGEMSTVGMVYLRKDVGRGTCAFLDSSVALSAETNHIP